eukprot:comp7381_c1_seq1/m.3071 comp7381_c1_seq1/g.3071  ORF comp7381_c1_seq1/g.3071 comp7381_c1_seq1/m.3071 type:complete len:255 (-) comp7381_c1_seq1:106-870(-)
MVMAIPVQLIPFGASPLAKNATEPTTGIKLSESGIFMKTSIGCNTQHLPSLPSSYSSTPASVKAIEQFARMQTLKRASDHVDDLQARRRAAEVAENTMLGALQAQLLREQDKIPRDVVLMDARECQIYVEIMKRGEFSSPFFCVVEVQSALLENAAEAVKTYLPHLKQHFRKNEELKKQADLYISWWQNAYNCSHADIFDELLQDMGIFSYKFCLEKGVENGKVGASEPLGWGQLLLGKAATSMGCGLGGSMMQ